MCYIFILVIMNVIDQQSFKLECDPEKLQRNAESNS